MREQGWRDVWGREMVFKIGKLTYLSYNMSTTLWKDTVIPLREMTSHQG